MITENNYRISGFFHAAYAENYNRKRAVHFGRPFFSVGVIRELLLVFMPHLFSKFSVFVLGDLFPSLLNNATHSILPPCSDLILLLNLIPSCQPLFYERAANKNGDAKKYYENLYENLKVNGDL
jgi:hypothetical protein